MQIKYIVHSFAKSSYQTSATLDNGTKVQVTIDGAVCELVSEDGSMSRTIKFTPDQINEASALYVVGSTILTNDSAVVSPVEVSEGEQV